MEIIKNDLHCDSVRISGQDAARLPEAAGYALRRGLAVLFSPAFVDAGEEETLAYFTECAKAAGGCGAAVKSFLSPGAS